MEGGGARTRCPSLRLMSSEAPMLLLADQTNAAGFISKRIKKCFMGQRSQRLLCQLIGEAERGTATHKGLRLEDDPFPSQSCSEGDETVLQYMFVLPLLQNSLFRYRPSFSAMKGHKVWEYQKNPRVERVIKMKMFPFL